MSDVNETEPKTKRVASPEQVEANRRNAGGSTGPRTPRGKAKSRGNAIKHGLRAAITLLPNEDAAEFDQYCENFFRTLKPIDAVERQIVNDVITSSWRLDRAVRCETAVVTKVVHAAALLHDLDGSETFEASRRNLAVDPRRASVELRNTCLGCEWMVARLDRAIGDLNIRLFWYASEFYEILSIFGLTMEDLFNNSLAYDLIQAFMIAGWDTKGDLLRVQALIRTPAPAGMPVYEYRDRVNKFAKRIDTDCDPEKSRAKLVELLLPEIEKLKKRFELLKPIDNYLYETSADRVMVDTTREGELRKRYEGGHRRDMLKAVRELGNYRKSIQAIGFDDEILILPEADYRTERAPNEPKRVAPEPAPAVEISSRNEWESVAPDVDEDTQAAKRPLGMPPVPNHRLNELIDNSIPDLNRLLMWSDELEDERDRKVKESEALI